MLRSVNSDLNRVLLMSTWLSCGTVKQESHFCSIVSGLHKHPICFKHKVYRMFNYEIG